MAETTANNGAGEPEAAAGATTDEEAAAATPRRKKRRRKKAKTSRPLRDLEQMERQMSKAAHRLSCAVTEGLATYRKRRDKSARKKRDGALRDLPLNATEAMARSLREASRVPVYMVRAVDTPSTRRLVRLGTRLMFFPFAR